MQKKYGCHFKGFLEGTDALWAAEEDASKSVINVMAIIEVNKFFANKEDIPIKVLLAMRKRLSSRLRSDYVPFPKMFYKRVVDYGYCFWSDDNDLTFEDYIRCIRGFIKLFRRKKNKLRSFSADTLPYRRRRQIQRKTSNKYLEL